MNSQQLKKWKENEIGRTKELFNNIKFDSVKDIYPEFDFAKPYTTSLDGYMPIGVLLPFFKKINVGIFPFLKSENDFYNWYGLYPKNLLWLYEIGKVNLRILFPDSLKCIPKYLNQFFKMNLPSTYRDFLFTEKVLGEEKYKLLSRRFDNIAGIHTAEKSIDRFEGNKLRAFNTAKRVYLQLHCFNYEAETIGFEELASKNINESFAWLEMCRLFKIGPHHYTMGGTHCVAKNVIHEKFIDEYKRTKFPIELGRIILKAFDLFNIEVNTPTFNFKDSIKLKLYENNELVNKLLFELSDLVENEKISVENVEDFKRLYKKTLKEDNIANKAFNLVAGTGVSILTAPLGLPGLLAGLGFTAVTSIFPELINNTSRNILKSFYNLKGKSALILMINKDLQKLYKF